jgi:4-hydroxy-3-methylbut-2-en-1-yl diphosphate synthase IspG/GcpE
LDNNIPIRIGVNAGSLEKDLQKKYVDVYYWTTSKIFLRQNFSQTDYVPIAHHSIQSQ